MKLKVTNADAETGTCILTELGSGKEHIVELDKWKWINSFAAEIFFTFRGQKFNVVCDMKAYYPDYL